MDQTRIATTRLRRFFVAGGALAADAPSYVVRQADTQLLNALSEGELCYLLDTRQVGKTSLLARTALNLRQAGATVLLLDMSAVCSKDVEAAQWYATLLYQAGVETGTTAECMAFWREHSEITLTARWFEAIENIILPHVPGMLYLFVDEVDAVRTLPFSVDPFFAAIRERYQRRQERSDLARLTFCLAGAATPSQLIADSRTTPFNVGKQIELTDFTQQEAAPLAQGLGLHGPALVSRVLHWTGGHPYLTQALCNIVHENPVRDRAGVDRLCKETFLRQQAWEKDTNLTFVRDQALHGTEEPDALLSLYLQVLARPIAFDPTNPIASHLRLSGLAIVTAGKLRSRNRIYKSVFNRKWAQENLIPAERRRQKQAMVLGIVRGSLFVGAIAAAVILGTLWSHAVQRADAAALVARQAKSTILSTQSELKALEARRSTLEQAVSQSEILAAEAEKRRKKATKERDLATVAKDQTRAEIVGLTGRLTSMGQTLQTSQNDLKQVREKTSRERTEQAILALRNDILIGKTATTIALTAAHQRTTERDQSALQRTVEAIEHDIAQGIPIPPELFQGLSDLTTQPFLRRLVVTLPFEIYRARFFADGKRLLVAGNNPWVYVLNGDTGQELLRLKASVNAQSKIHLATVSPNGRWIVTGSDSGEVHLWDTAAPNRPVVTLNVGAQESLVGVVSPDSKQLFVSTSTGGGLLYSLENRQSVPISAQQKGITCADFGEIHGRASALLTGGNDGTVQAWDIPSGLPRGKTRSQLKKVTAIKRAGNVDVLFADAQGRLECWNWEYGFSTNPNFEGANVYITGIANIDWLVAGASQEGVIQVWSYGIRDQRPVLTLDNHRGTVYDVSESPNNQELISCGQDRTVQIWTRTLPIIPNGFGRPRYVEFARDGHHILTATHEGLVSIKDSLSLDQRWLGVCPQADRPGLSCATLSPDERSCVTADRKGRLRIWNVEGWPQWKNQESAGFQRSLDAHTQPITRICFMPNGRTLASASLDGTIKFWETAGWSLRQTLSVGTPIYSIYCSHDGRWIAATCGDHTIRIFDSQTGKLHKTLVSREPRPTAISNPPIGDISFSPNDELLGVVGEDGTVSLWNWKNSELLGEIPGNTSTLAFSPSNQQLALSGVDGNIRLWQLSECLSAFRAKRLPQAERVLRGSLGRVNAIRYSPDGDRIITAGEDGLTRIFPATLTACLDQGHRQLARLETALPASSASRKTGASTPRLVKKPQSRVATKQRVTTK